MNSQFLLEKLENSEEFKKFKEENPDAYLCSGFFTIDMGDDPKNNYHFDFYIPSSKKTFSFELEEGIKLKELERFDEIILEKISMENHFDFDNLKERIMNEMELKHVSNKIQKMIFSMQNKEGKEILMGTIFLSSLGLISTNFDLKNKEMISFEKKSLFDMMKIMKK
jgi:hypothetical protein